MEIDIEGTPTRVLVEPVGAVDVSRLGQRVGDTTAQEMWGIDESLLVVLGVS